MLTALKLDLERSQRRCMLVNNLRVPLPKSCVLDEYINKMKDSNNFVGVVLNSRLSFCKSIKLFCGSCFNHLGANFSV